MKKINKNKKNILNNINLNKKYSINESIFLVKKYAFAKFNESIDLAINLNVDKKYINKISNSISLPYKINKKKKIAILTNKKNLKKINNKKKYFIDKNEIINQIKFNKIIFDILITTPDYLKKINFANKKKYFKKKFPNYKNGTLTNNIFETLLHFENNLIKYKSDKFGIIHISIGKISFKNSYIKKNFLYFIKDFKKKYFFNIKKKYFKKIIISSTMGVGILINTENI